MKMVRSKGLLSIFGILFILGSLTIFGMVMGVGLMVHHKINVQNSVDIGAMYAAQRQAETLSVLSHLNYQLRQNYKLFSYRYNVLGNIGAYQNPGGATANMDLIGIARPRSVPSKNKTVCPNTLSGCSTGAFDPSPITDCHQGHSRRVGGGGGCPFAFCVWHPYFDIPGKNGTDNVCQRVDQPYDLPPLAGGSTYGARFANAEVSNRISSIRDSCRYSGYVNWMVASTTYLSFYEEQKKRKEFIKKYFNEIISKKRELGGAYIDVGVKNTITKNFTYPVYESYRSRNGIIYTKTSNEGNFDEYFEWITINPPDLDLFYVQDRGRNNSQSACEREIKTIFEICEAQTCSSGTSCNLIQRHTDNSNSNICDGLKTIKNEPVVVGFMKKQNTQNFFYIQIFLHINYKSAIFFPFREPISLVAEAYSKPFGSSFGPYKNALLPTIPPTSRYPVYSLSFERDDDNYGLLDGQRQYYFNKLIRKIVNVNGGAKDAGLSLQNYQQLHGLHDVNNNNSTSAMVLPYEDGSSNNYVLKKDKIFTLPARVLEEIAIAPDEYDLNHYAILPNYMVSAYIRLMESKNNRGDYIFNYVPADIGHYADEEFLNKIRNSPSPLFADDLGPEYIQHLRAPPPPLKPQGFLETGSYKIPFYLNYTEKQINWVNVIQKEYFHPKAILEEVYFKLFNIDHLLTSWVSSMDPQGPTLDDIYPPAPNVMGNRAKDCKGNDVPFQCCHLRDTELKTASLVVKRRNGVPYLRWDRKQINRHILHFSHCIVGGRTGFSIKIIDREFPGVRDLLQNEKRSHGF